ncbi:MAG: PAS domain-containing protein, partial [Synergistaceae bacterium]|nr:PAS domain-containing protein [Synergistaceae bacterium]
MPDHERRLFIDTIKRLGNNSIFLQLHDDGHSEALFVSPEYSAMMEDSQENAERFSESQDFSRIIHPEDRQLVGYMLKNHEAHDKSSSIQIRMITAANRVIWCDAHYSFFSLDSGNYVYITFHDITLFKNYEEKIRTSYDSLGQTFYHQDEHTLGMFRVDLTLDIVEEARGKDLFRRDKEQDVYSEFLRLRSRQYINFMERKQFLETFSVASLLDAYVKSRIGVKQVLLSRREKGTICYVEISAMMTRSPFTGNVIAFISERECNNHKVYQTIVDKILARQFEMIAYMSLGRYSITVKDILPEGSILPKAEHSTFNSYINDEILPILHGTDEQKHSMAHSLAPDAIAFGTQKDSLYEVNIACDIDGKIFHKQFNFYAVNPGFY